MSTILKKIKLTPSLITAIHRHELKARDLISFLLGEGFCESTGKKLDEIALQDLQCGERFIKRTSIDQITGFVHIELYS